MYTYAFCKTPVVPLELPQGITTPVQTADVVQLTAIIEPGLSLELLQQDDTLLLQAVLAHDRVMHTLFLQTTVLPLCFGTCFRSPEGLLAHLHTHQQTYLNQLSQLEGKAEYALKLTPISLSTALVAPVVTGKDYFLAKKQQYQAQLRHQTQQQAALRQIEQAIIQTYPQHRFSEAQSETRTIYLLVERDRAQQLTQHVQSWQQQHPQWQLLLGEALPPYHFVSNEVAEPLR